MAAEITVLGALAAGLFVGGVLSLALTESKLTVQAAVTIIGAALGGVPIAYLGPSSTIWAYPIGLLLGLVSTRIRDRIPDIAAKWGPRVSQEKLVLGWFAWFELAAFVLTCCLMLAYAIYADFLSVS